MNAHSRISDYKFHHVGGRKKGEKRTFGGVMLGDRAYAIVTEIAEAESLSKSCVVRLALMAFYDEWKDTAGLKKPE